MDKGNLLHHKVIGLERENRRIRLLLLSLIVVLSTILLLGSSTNYESKDAHFRIVYASKFALKDPRTGKVRAQLAHQTRPGGWAGITLWDNAGQPRAEFKMWEDGRTHLVMMDADRRVLTKLSVSSDGEPSFSLDGKEMTTFDKSNKPLQ